MNNHYELIIYTTIVLLVMLTMLCVTFTNIKNKLVLFMCLLSIFIILLLSFVILGIDIDFNDINVMQITQ